MKWKTANSYKQLQASCLMRKFILIGRTTSAYIFMLYIEQLLFAHIIYLYNNIIKLIVYMYLYGHWEWHSMWRLYFVINQQANHMYVHPPSPNNQPTRPASPHTSSRYNVLVCDLPCWLRHTWFRVYFRLNRTLKSIILIIIYFVYALPVHFHIIFLPASPGNMRMRLLCSGIHCWPSAAPQHDAYRIREYTTKCIIPNNN